MQRLQGEPETEVYSTDGKKASNSCDSGQNEMPSYRKRYFTCTHTTRWPGDIAKGVKKAPINQEGSFTSHSWTLTIPLSVTESTRSNEAQYCSIWISKILKWKRQFRTVRGKIGLVLNIDTRRVSLGLYDYVECIFGIRSPC